MELLTYFFISLLSYLGIFAGYFILMSAPEEKKPGMKYFIGLNYLLFFILAVAAILIRFDVLISIICLLAAALFILIKKYQLYITYILSAFLLYFFYNSDKFLIFPALIFAYGLVAGAIIFDAKHKKESFLKLFVYSYFPIITILLKIIL